MHLPSSELCTSLPAFVGTDGVTLLMLEIGRGGDVARVAHYRLFPCKLPLQSI